MIYLDSAATTLEKPSGVASSIAWAVNHLASPGRGGHRASMRAAEIMYRCRETAARMFHVGQPEQVILTSNATHALNLAIHSLVRPGSVVLISGYEHNAVTRPLCQGPRVRVKVAAGPLFDPDGVYEAFERELTDEVDVVICNHVSNVFGFIQPVDRIAALCRRRGKPLIVDASQSAGTLPVDLTGWGAAFVAMPGHKGLYGPQGTGLLLCNAQTLPLLYGGTGSVSSSQQMPDFLPDRLEAGTQNVCGAAGLLAGMRFVQSLGVERICQHEQKLCRRMMDGMEDLPGIQLYRGGNAVQSGLFSFRIEGMDCEAVGESLSRRGIAVRAGLHCAPIAHRTVGTLESGTVRVSFSAFNQTRQIERVIAAVRAVIWERAQ